MSPPFRSRLLAAALALASSGFPAGGHAGPTAVSAELPYALPNGLPTSQATIDLYRARAESPAPLVLLVHGGSWVGGDKSHFRTSAPHFIDWWLDRGFVVAAVNFRLATRPGVAPKVSPTDQAADIAHALAALHANAAAHGIDPSRPAVAVGFSSGAHLVALLGADGHYLEDAGLPETHLAATLSLDVHAYDVPHALELMQGSVVERNVPLIRHLFGQTVEAQRTASPAHHTDGYVAPALLISAEADIDQPGTHGHVAGTATRLYAEKLTATGHTGIALHLGSRSHDQLAAQFGAPGDPAAAAVEVFLKGQGLL